MARVDQFFGCLEYLTSKILGRFNALRDTLRMPLTYRDNHLINLLLDYRTLVAGIFELLFDFYHFSKRSIMHMLVEKSTDIVCVGMEFFSPFFFKLRNEINVQHQITVSEYRDDDLDRTVKENRYSVFSQKSSLAGAEVANRNSIGGARLSFHHPKMSLDMGTAVLHRQRNHHLSFLHENHFLLAQQHQAAKNLSNGLQPKKRNSIKKSVMEIESNIF